MIRRGFLVFLAIAALCTVPSSAVLGQGKNATVNPVPRGGGWMKRHLSMNERVAKGNVDLVFIGDSITHSWERGGKNVWQKYYGNRNAVNLGIGGDRTQHVIWRLQNGNLKGISPKLAVIMIGTNNSGSDSPKAIAEGVKAIVKELQTRTPKTKILVLAIFPRGENSANKRRKVNEKANMILKTFADEKSVFYLDIGKNFLEDDGTLSKKIMPDLLHLSGRGYQIWAESMEPTLVNLLKD